MKNCLDCNEQHNKSGRYCRRCSYIRYSTKKCLKCDSQIDKRNVSGLCRECKPVFGVISHYKWVGGENGKYIDKNGYVWVTTPPGHGRRLRGQRRMPEHRLVIEQNINRELFDFETVHHINGVRDDNRIENLELWARTQPPGQRVEDKIIWAKEFLSSYGYTVSQNPILLVEDRIDNGV